MKRLKGAIAGLFSFVKIDYSFFAMLILFVFLEDLKWYLMYLVFLVLHESCHLWVAKRLGYLPKKLKLTAFGASLEGFDDFLISDEVKIVLAGPIFNLSVVVLCYLSFWFEPESFCYLEDVLLVNQSILLFNLLPIFPLDAGRLVLCFLSRKSSRREAVKITKNISLILIVFVFLFAVFSFAFSFNFSLGFAMLNLCILLFESASGTSYKREISLHKKIERLNKGVSQKTIFVKKDYSEPLLLKFIDGEHYYLFVFVDENFVECRRLDEFNLLKNLGFI